MSDPTAHPYHPQHPFFGCQLKMEWAKMHIQALDKAIDEFNGSNPYEIVDEYKSETNYYVIRFKIRQRPPLDWSPLLGDIVHNMRSALDHLAWQLILRNDEEPSRGNLFPIFTSDPFDPTAHASEGEFKTARKRWKDRIRRLHPNDIAHLKLLQPYQRGDDASSDWLARLNELSNWDKHREFHFTGQCLMEYEFSVSKTTRNATPRPIYFKPKGEILKHDEVVARFDPRSLGPNPNLDLDFTLFFQIAFGEGSPLEGLMVKSVLPELFNHVMAIIRKFKERFDNQDFSPPSIVKG